MQAEQAPPLPEHPQPAPARAKKAKPVRIRTYAYKLRTSQGVVLKGKVRALSQDQALSLVGQPEAEVLKLKPVGDGFTLGTGYRKVSTEELVLFSTQLSSFIVAGLPLVDALGTIGSESASRLMQDTMRQLSRDLVEGDTLSNAMAKHPKVFPSAYLDLVRAGEATGTLDTVLDRAATYLERQNEATKKIKAALTYPAVVGIVAIGTIVVLVTYVLPKFVVLFNNFHAKLPLPTRMLISFTDFIGEWWSVILGIVVVVSVGVWLWQKTPSGRYSRDRMLLGMPGLGPVIEMAILERFCSTLSLLVRAGVPIVNSFQVLIDGTNNRVFQRALTTVRAAMMTGSGMAGPVAATGVFPRLVPQMMRVGESTGTLDDQMEIASVMFGRRLDYGLKRFTGVFEPIVIVIMGLIVGFVAIALVSAMYGIFGQVRQFKS